MASPSVVCIGNPLAAVQKLPLSTASVIWLQANVQLDIQVSAAQGPAYLEKYGLKSNDAILAEEKHMPIYEDIVANADVTYVAGGAAQNAARGASYVLPPKSVAYIGSVGDDDLTQTLSKVNETEGVISAYQIQPAPAKTGACAVILSNHDRSLVTTLRAAEMFTPDHLKKPEVAALIDGAQYFYIGGFFLTHGVESALEIAKAASSKGKTVVLNLSAPFIPQFFKVQLGQLLPHVDILIGNESEAAAYAEAAGLGDAQLPQIASALAASPKSNPSRPRIVIITQGADSTLVASSQPSASPVNLSPEEENPKVFPVPKLADDKIVDTNGAGDMFAGGFLGAIAQGKTLNEAIEVGHKLGQMCCGQIGPKLEFPKVNVL
ncbi:adenosine kinase [Trichosporon asahii var. asahii CBS 2479]|uniref:Adenosine kinase n=1 Tax=Trichosporon asahii var. asahii (strain ATCC 90039 / CBS 2479 / JCM 2466 / KCTC 7840 / NBRC 103889/ NCYC 2677 / UAMH 7654) TaxID=1186058 RepID=J5T4G0_TRIAS|nr:adenosine kinase [Trichosporon asahii var. asahii CBS 2479]EJT49111.1 adenosine kinase [Trichosporon asahii var. asahii CBS 2479]